VKEFRRRIRGTKEAHVSRCSCRSHGSFLTAKGLEEAEQRRAGPSGDREVDMGQTSFYLDKVGSVSALIEPSEPIFVDAILDEQHRRFLNGS